jgi:FkbM family methyltransferase
MKDQLSIDDIFLEDIEVVKKRERNLFENLAKEMNDQIVLFGAGALGKKVFRCLKDNGLNVLAFCDSNQQKWQTEIEGIPVLSPSDAARQLGDAALFIVTIWIPRHRFTETKDDLLEKGCFKVIHFNAVMWRYANLLLPHYSFELPHKLIEQELRIREVFNLYSDEESRQLFLANLSWKIHLNFDYLPKPNFNNQYFLNELYDINDTEVFVDCGAYNGDTITNLLRQNNKLTQIVAFEPDSSNIHQLREYIATLDDTLQRKINIFPYAVGNKKEKVFFEASGAPWSFVKEDGLTEVECVILDESLYELKPTFLKFDIEGGEMDALRGSNKIIRDFKPIVAVSVYHKPSDLWDIPLYLNSLSSNYNFYLRSHDYDSIDTVCYAIPHDRLRDKKKGR